MISAITPAQRQNVNDAMFDALLAEDKIISAITPAQCQNVNDAIFDALLAA